MFSTNFSKICCSFAQNKFFGISKMAASNRFNYNLIVIWKVIS